MIFNRRKPSPQHGAHPRPAGPKSDEPSFIGPEMRVEGNIVSEGEVHIAGVMVGNIQAATCLVENNALVQGGISAQHVVVRGRVLGPITAGQLSITKGAHVEGNVLHQGLSIERGAFVMGNIAQGMPQSGNDAGAPGSNLFANLDEPSLPSPENED